MCTQTHTHTHTHTHTQVRDVTEAHHHALKFDYCRAYYFGQNYLVRMRVGRERVRERMHTRKHAHT